MNQLINGRLRDHRAFFLTFSTGNKGLPGMPGAVWFTALCTLGGTHVEDGVGGLAAQLDGGLDLYRMHGSRTFHEALHQEAIMWYHDVAPRLHRPEPSRLI